MNEFAPLLRPLTINRVTLRNRILMTGHVTDFGVDNLPSEQHVAYYRDRAKGGCSLIVMAFPSIHPTSRNSRSDVNAFTDDVIPGLRRIADAVHEHGAKMFVQLGHSGRQQTSLWTETALWAPSAAPCPINQEMPKEMELEDIEEVVRGHAETAIRIKEAGMDGVEIHSGYGGYLLSSFMSPYMNFRTDEYGGSFENRMRLPLQVIDAVRDAVGPDYVVGMQTQGADFSPDGIDEGEGRRIAKLFADTSKLDYLTVKASTYASEGQNVPDMQHPKGLWLDLAVGIRAVTGPVPVFAVGRLNDAREATGIIESGAVDMIAMTRQHIADPETVNKLAEGRADDVNWCIAINQGCLDKLAAGHHVTCAINPSAGYERTMGIGTLKPATERQRILVVGAGPGGMKAAEIAARRGHRVTIVDHRETTGGQLQFAAALPGREDIRPAIDYLDHQIRKLGVEVRLGETATVESVLAEDADRVVIATGATAKRIVVGNLAFGNHEVPGLDGDAVTTVLDVLERGASVGKRILVVDDGEGGWKAIASAFGWDEAGHDVTLITPHPYVGAKLGPYTQHKLIGRLLRSGIDARPFTTLASVDGNTAALVDHGKNKAETFDSIVLAGWHVPDTGLYFGLKGKHPSVTRIGDAVAARTMHDAIREGERLVREW
ncbi:FAD-dependent oxidoreductase [Ruicaihuangia caeni]|uniref:FAD-dependent oxidoreductase n=1 Tax=Ruicaihuangia caeni TaxID=3042517 RepID=A0AAW6T0Q4_9MICO|nr:FAD-dependent oxidoreductase [Klugiella sp. YN-L-19]MDI2097387.1 FAD-dependent oxidoreductase [Klugiella sp. YN-L-19]